jgi:hypothetical protein
MWAVSMGPPRHIVSIDPDTLQATLVPDMPQVSKIASDPRGGFWLGLNNGDLDHFNEQAGLSATWALGSPQVEGLGPRGRANYLRVREDQRGGLATCPTIRGDAQLRLYK